MLSLFVFTVSVLIRKHIDCCLSYVTIINGLNILLAEHSLIPCPVLVPLGCHWEQNQTDQSNYTCEEKVDETTVSDWRVLYHFATGPWLLEGQGNDDNGIEELKDTSDGMYKHTVGNVALATSLMFTLTLTILLLISCWKRWWFYNEPGQYNPYKIVSNILNFAKQHIWSTPQC